MTRHGWREKKAGAPNLQASSWIPPIFFIIIFFFYGPGFFFSGCRPCSSLSRNWATMGLTGFFERGPKPPKPHKHPPHRIVQKRGTCRTRVRCGCVADTTSKCEFGFKKGNSINNNNTHRLTQGGGVERIPPRKHSKKSMSMSPPRVDSHGDISITDRASKMGGRRKMKNKKYKREGRKDKKEKKTKRKKKRKEGINTNVHTTEAIFFSHVRYSCAVTWSFQDRELFNNRCHTISRDCR